MAIYYVDSAASGDDSGDDWTNAAPSLAIDWGATITPATDIVYVDDGHDENVVNASATITGSTAEGTTDPVVILCVDKADDSLSTGAKVRATGSGTTNVDLLEKLWIHGVEFYAVDSIRCTPSVDGVIHLEQCRIEPTGNSTFKGIILGSRTAHGQKVEMVDTDVDFSGGTSNSFHIRGGRNFWDGGTLDVAVTSLINALESDAAAVDFNIRNVDLSIQSGNLVNVANTTSALYVNLERCKLHADVTLASGTIDVPGFEIRAHLCDDGTDADPAVNKGGATPIPILQTYHGQVFLDLARYRTGGASDGERANPYSWSMDAASASSNVIEIYEALESPVIAGWTDGDASTPHTYRIYVANTGVLQDDEIWFVLTGPNDAATDSLGLKPGKDATHDLGTRLNPLGTPANIGTADDGSWTGADTTDEQYMEITYTPDKPGPITARVYLAKADRVSVDPKIYIDP